MAKSKREVVHGTFVDTPDSPQVDIATFTGIKIAVPAAQSLKEIHNGIQLSGTWVFTEETRQDLGPKFTRNFRYQVREVDTKNSWEGKLLKVHITTRGRPNADVPAEKNARDAKPRPAKKGTDKVRLKGFFNFDLARAWDVPERAGKYRVIVTLGDMPSNEVDFQVTEKQP